MNSRLQLAMAATAIMSRMYEDNRCFETHEPRAITPERTVRFSSESAPLFRDNRQLKEFSIKGRKVMAYSRKDAITRLKHMKKK